jgi:hypothetical protein
MEIERTLSNYGASQFVSGWDEKKGQAVVQFQMRDRRIRFIVELPKSEELRTFERKTRTRLKVVERTDSQVSKEREQELRRRWRALLLVVKAKLEAVDSNISSFDEEFMAHIVTESGRTIGEMIIPQLDKVAASGHLPPLLPGKSEK